MTLAPTRYTLQTMYGTVSIPNTANFLTQNPVKLTAINAALLYSAAEAHWQMNKDLPGTLIEGRHPRARGVPWGGGFSGLTSWRSPA